MMKGVPELRESHIVPGNVIESAFCQPPGRRGA